MMRPEFWQDRWRTGQIGFHQPAVDSSLQRLWPQLGIDAGASVFVPLCGKSLDMLWLRDRGHPVVGVELSAKAIETFLAEHGIGARRRPGATLDTYEAPCLQLLCGDYFQIDRAALGAVGAVYDRAALISWLPELRKPYVDHLIALTGTGTRVLLIALEYLQEQMQGPPFSIGPGDVESLYSRHFDHREISRQDILPSEPRLRAKGVTRLDEVCYRLVRR